MRFIVDLCYNLLRYINLSVAIFEIYKGCGKVLTSYFNIIYSEKHGKMSVSPFNSLFWLANPSKSCQR